MMKSATVSATIPQRRQPALAAMTAFVTPL